MKQSAQKIETETSWKQEVHQRIAEHKVRRNGATPRPQANSNAQQTGDTRASRAAARVAARYAKAPSYSEMIADEARAAVRAAEVASMAALEAQAAAESVLAGLEAASSASHSWEPDFFAPATPEPVWTPAPQPLRAVASPTTQPSAEVQAAVLPAAVRQTESTPPFEIRWDADLPTRESAIASQPITSSHQASAPTPWDDMPDALGPLESFGVVEPAQPIHANLIEFPRELVATRKLRPRRAEGGHAAGETQTQLSIFEVEPWAISTEPEATGAAAEAGTAVYAGPDWSGIELDPEPHAEFAHAAALPAPAVVRAAAAEPLELEVAPISRRLLAGVVDFSLITGLFFGVSMLVLTRVEVLPALKSMEISSAAGFAGIALLYLAFFFALAKATPGMKYANLQIRTFAGHVPTRPERLRRMATLLLSLVPLGLGAIWALFDEQHLCWHDRLSGTYLRQGRI